MAKPYPIELRERVVAAVVSGGMSRSGAARRFKVALSTAIGWVKRFLATGSVAPGRPGGHKPKSIVGAYRDFMRNCQESCPLSPWRADGQGSRIRDSIHHDLPPGVYLCLDENGSACANGFAPGTAPALVRELAQACAQTSVVGPPRAIAHHRPIGTDQGTGPALAHVQVRPQLSERTVSDGGALGAGPYHFFDSSSFSPALSSMLSPKSFLRFAFSSSSARSRRASDTSMPPKRS